MKERGRTGKPDISRRTALTGVVGATSVGALGGCASASEPTSSDSFAGTIGLTFDDSEPRPVTTREPTAGKPNVVVILLDDVGFSDFGCFGGEISTPSIDHLAQRGLRFTNFHTNGVCAATRASLLTGLNPHSAGIGWLTYEDAGFPGYRGDLSPTAVTMAEVFLAAGYKTYHSGKWHVNIGNSVSSVGPMDNWPLQRGFMRSHWFQGHSIDFFRPTNLFEGNERVDPDVGQYYATDAFTDRAIAFLTDHVAQAPDSPFFLLLAHAAAHSPLQAPRDEIEAQRGRYDRGWDQVRAARFDRQRELGLFGDSVRLPPRNPGERAWDALGEDEKRLYARYMEIYAAMIHRVDQGISKLVAFLGEARLLDNTILVLLSDNGGSPDGGAEGTPNMLAGRSGGVTLREAMEVFDDLGGPNSYPMYPTGWAAVSNTPFRLYKHDTHLGGVADPLIIHWPHGITQAGQIRRQYFHVSDLLPTLADCAGVTMPDARLGRPARPIQGVTIRSAIVNANAPEVRSEQHFELSGSRALYSGGWRLVSTGRFQQPGDRWELFNVRVDPSETTDLAQVRPDVVASLERRWFAAARRYDVLPIDTRPQREKSFADFYAGGSRSHWSFIPPTDLVQPEAAPNLFGRSHSIEITLDPIAAADEGILFAYGNLFLGCTSFIRSRRLHYEFVSWPNRIRRIDAALPLGAKNVRVVHELTERPWVGVTQLFVDEVRVGELSSHHWPFGRTFQGLQIGRNIGAPVSQMYSGALEFSGKICRVEISLDNSPYTPDEIARSNTPPRSIE